MLIYFYNIKESILIYFTKKVSHFLSVLINGLFIIYSKIVFFIMITIIDFINHLVDFRIYLKCHNRQVDVFLLIVLLIDHY